MREKISGELSEKRHKKPETSRKDTVTDTERKEELMEDFYGEVRRAGNVHVSYEFYVQCSVTL